MKSLKESFSVKESNDNILDLSFVNKIKNTTAKEIINSINILFSHFKNQSIKEKRYKSLCKDCARYTNDESLYNEEEITSPQYVDNNDVNDFYNDEDEGYSYLVTSFFVPSIEKEGKSNCKVVIYSVNIYSAIDNDNYIIISGDITEKEITFEEILG